MPRMNRLYPLLHHLVLPCDQDKRASSLVRRNPRIVPSLRCVSGPISEMVGGGAPEGRLRRPLSRTRSPWDPRDTERGGFGTKWEELLALRRSGCTKLRDLERARCSEDDERRNKP